MSVLDHTLSNCQDCIEKSQCFNNLIPEELQFISEHKEQIIYKPGETICKQGAFANYVMYVAEGLVKTHLETVNDKIINLKIIQGNEFIGFSSLCGETSYNYSAVSLKKSKICLLDNESFKLLMKNDKFSIEIMKLYCRNEAHIYSRLKSIGYKYMMGRLADAIFYLCDPKYENDHIFDYILRKDIADFACISKESTIKLLMDLNEHNIIRLSGRKVEILDVKRLQDLSKNG